MPRKKEVVEIYGDASDAEVQASISKLKASGRRVRTIPRPFEGPCGKLCRCEEPCRAPEK